jgi:hypothetical protein
MKRVLVLFFLLPFLFSCEKLLEVLRFPGPCTIELIGGQRITTPHSIEILESTGTITFRDENGKLWSIKADEYVTYTCGK